MYNIKKRRKLEFFFPMAKALKTIVTKSCKDSRKFSQADSLHYYETKVYNYYSIIHFEQYGICSRMEFNRKTI